MKLGRLRQIITGMLIACLLFSTGASYKAVAEDNDVRQMLMNLTDQQRKALNELEITPMFVISPDINQMSPELVNIIVEFNHDPAEVEVAKDAAKGKRMSLSSAKNKVKNDHDTFRKEWKTIKSLNRLNEDKMEDSTITREYHEAFNGVAMTLPGTAVQELLSTGVVKRIWRDHEVKLDLPEEASEMKASTPSKVDDSVVQIGADKLHEENITGKGVKVGVIDSGIDYNHPDLKEAFKGGYDFVDEDDDPMEATYQEWKDSGRAEFEGGSSYYTLHGTHVAGSIAAQKKNSSASAVKGVAPDVDLYAYRVLGPYGRGSTGSVMAGIDKAVKDGMDVINLSLGTSVNDPLSPTSIAVNNAMLSGIVTVVAAGNSGPGEKTLGSPGAAALVISVGASDMSLTIPTITVSAGDATITNMKLLARSFTDNLVDLENKTLPIIDVGIGTKADFTNKDVAGKVAVIQRGIISFDEKVQNAKAAGAKAVIVYNNVDGEIEAYLGEGTNYIPSFRIAQTDGEHLLSQSEITFGSLDSIQTEGDRLAEFSSRGPAVGNDDIKPDVVAPGVAIFSTIPEYIHDPQDGKNYDIAYTRLQGTSMAAPHVAGTAALILQAHPEYTPFDVKAALMNTADEMNGEYSVNEIGSGRINAYEAVHTETLVKVMDKTLHEQDGNLIEIDEETGSIAFGSHFITEDGPIEDSRKVVIQNLNEQELKEYNISVAFLPAKGQVQDAEENGVEVVIPNTVSVEAGKSVEINPTIRVSEHAKFGRYEGYIYIVNTNNEEAYQLPFSIRVGEKGLEYMRLSRPMISNDASNLHPYSTLYAHVYLKLTSPLEMMDVLVRDGETGDAIGFIGTFNSRNVMTGIDYFIERFFTGEVYPFTNSPTQPISDKKVKLPEGYYTFEMIGYDSEGKSYSKEDIVMIDNTPPVVEVSMEPGIYEVNDSMYTIEAGYDGPAVWVHGNVYDSTVDVLKEKGKNIDQSVNGVLWWEYNYYLHYFLAVNSEGNFRFPAMKSTIDNMTYIDSNLFVFDNATASVGYPQGIKRYQFIKEGTEYAVPSYDKEKVRLGEEITMTLNLNNIKQLSSGEFTIPFYTKYFEFQNVKVNEAFKKYAEENGVNVKLDEPTLNNGNVKVGASMEDSDLIISQGIPFLDITFKVINDEYYSLEEGLSFAITAFRYKKTSDSNVTSIRVFRDKSFTILAAHSLVNGNYRPEAFLKDNGQLDNTVDYSKLGAKVYAKNMNGKTYEASIIHNNGHFVIDNLPITEQEYDIYVQVPGHLTSKTTETLGRYVDGELVGSRVITLVDNSVAGDVNGDKMIDINDAILAVFSYGKKNVGVNKGDINQDGIVDEKDLRYIEKNFLKIGPDAKDGVQPKEKQGNVTLEQLFKSIGLELNN
ncbi:S8 family serine peptidase [Sutcliffiella halmapala]|uniref:S8 family serine peptidase n=1 Tax=Sutcliffiella halmapala TaxID=79882 RepID=UPI000995DD1A|nr:S8 family serine peptidase [Sutcliffiella halmapala]